MPDPIFKIKLEDDSAAGPKSGESGAPVLDDVLEETRRAAKELSDMLAAEAAANRQRRRPADEERDHPAEEAAKRQGRKEYEAEVWRQQDLLTPRDVIDPQLESAHEARKQQSRDHEDLTAALHQGGMPKLANMNKMFGNKPDVPVAEGKELAAGEGSELPEVTAAAEAGPAAPIVAAAMMVADQVAGTLKSFRQGVEGASLTLQSFASNDNDAALRKMGDGLSSAAEKVPIIGKVWAEEIRLVQSFGRAITDVSTSLVNRGREIEGYSGELARAGAQSDVRDLLMDIKEAQYMGNDLASLEDVMTDIRIEMRELILPIKNMLVHILTPFMQLASQVLKALEPLGGMIEKFGTKFFDMFVNPLFVFLERFVDAHVQILNALGLLPKEKKDLATPAERWDDFKMMAILGKGQREDGWKGVPAAAGRMNIPIVMEGR